MCICHQLDEHLIFLALSCYVTSDTTLPLAVNVMCSFMRPSLLDQLMVPLVFSFFGHSLLYPACIPGFSSLPRSYRVTDELSQSR